MRHSAGNLLPRRFRSSVASLPSVRVGLPSNIEAKPFEQPAIVLTRMLTTTMDNPGPAWPKRTLDAALIWDRGPAWTPVDDFRLTRNASFSGELILAELRVLGPRRRCSAPTLPAALAPGVRHRGSL
jgi:hypothetical protein